MEDDKKKSDVDIGPGRPRITDPRERSVQVAFRLKQWILDELLPKYDGKITPMMNDAIDLLLEKHRNDKVSTNDIVNGVKEALSDLIEKIEGKNKK